MARGGKRPGSGRKPGVKLPDARDRDCAARLLEALNEPAKPKESFEIAQWRMLTEAEELTIRLRARMYLYDKRDGKAVQPVDFGSKPVSVIVDLDSAAARRAADAR